MALIVALTAVATPDEAPHTSLQLLDLAGGRVEPLQAVGARVTVFVFARTDCPISNRYAPELQRLHRRFAPAGVRFWLVYPDPGEPPEAIRRHLHEFGYVFDALRDPEHTLVRLTRATVTPEAAVFVGTGGEASLVYRGRIDDRYVDLGRSRAAPTTRDLEELLRALGEGRALAPRTTVAVGCWIAPLE